MENSKIFYLIDLNTFKGTRLNNKQYCFINSKNQKIITDSLHNFITESDPAFLGYYKDTNPDLKNAFDFKIFVDVNDAVKQFGFEWHDKTANLVANTTYELTDSNKGLKMTVLFNNEVDWDNFCNVCQTQAISHGFKHYKLGAFYNRSQKKGDIATAPLILT